LSKRIIKLTLSYQGTRYLGWQKAKDGPSIQYELEKALSTVLQEPLSVEAASRTDAGVHARGQVAAFSTESMLPPLNRFQHSLNCVLPRDIAILEVKEAAASFHPTLDSIGKEYHYSICTGKVQLPFHREFSWHFPHPLDLREMQRAAFHFIGKKNFMALCTEKNEHPYADYEREITTIDLIGLEAGRWLIKVAGSAFLYKMVRTLVGTLAYVGCGKIASDEIPAILEGGQRAQAGMTAPAHGLSLERILYHF